MKQKTTPTGQPTAPLVTIKKLRILLIDIFGLLMAFWVTFFLDKRFYLQHPLPYGTAEVYAADTLRLALICIAVHLFFDILFLSLFRLYRSLWQFAGIDEMVRVLAAVGCSRFVSLFAYLVVCSFHYDKRGYVDIHESSMLLFMLLTCFFYIAVRFGYRVTRSMVIRRNTRAPRVIIVGAGSGGSMMLEYLSRHPDEGRPVCLVDDDPKKIGYGFKGVYVDGSTQDLEALTKKHDAQQIWIAIPGLEYGKLRAIVNYAAATGCKVMNMTGLSESGKGSIQLRNINVEDVLFREVKEFLDPKECAYLNDAVVLVTGGGGSIGSEICRQVASRAPKKLIIFDIYENNAFELMNELKKKFPELDAAIRIGSVRDKSRLNEVFEEFHPQVVFHAAAHKHVPLMEDSPAEAIKNNVFGTLNTIRCADEYGVERFVLLSTDKAVNPTNVMGATKHIAELLVQTANTRSKCNFVAVRFGNVLGSNGSVIPIFRKQLQEGGPLTVTHPDITRYFMTIREAAQLVLEAGGMANGGEIFVLDMGKPIKIVDLARNLILQSGLRPDVDIKIEFTGLRPGEKLYEELSTEEEKKKLRKTAKDKIFVNEPIEQDVDWFYGQIDRLAKVTGKDEALILEIIQELIPTFRHNTN